MQKITIEKSELLKSLQLASRAISSKPIIPLLANVMLEVQNGNARMTGTNYDFGIRTNFIVNNDAEFTTAIPAKLFTDLISSIQSENIELKYDETKFQLTLKTDKSNNNIKCMSAESFPAFVSVENPINVPTIEFKEAVNRVAFSASVSKMSVLDGVLLVIDKGKLILCATDGNRLSYEEIELNDLDKKKTLSAIINATMLENIARILDGEFFEMSANESQVRFRSGKNEMIAQIIDGQFPDYNLLKPAKSKINIEVQTIEMLNACKQLELFTENGYTKFEVNEKTIKMSAITQETGSSVVSVDAVVKGDPILLGLNVFYFKEFLQVCKTGEFTIDLVNNKDMILFHMKDFLSYYHIIMPMGLIE